jgi:two-component system NtrC family response regulator
METAPLILIVEDDSGLQKQYKWLLSEYQLAFAGDYESVCCNISKGVIPSVAIVDLGLPPDPDNTTEGIKVVDFLLSNIPDIKIIVATGDNNSLIAHNLLNKGVFEYINKSDNIHDVIPNIVKRALYLKNITDKAKQVFTFTIPRTQDSTIIGNSHIIKHCIATCDKIAKTAFPVILHGESGTGKELFARRIHESSERKGQFVAINCPSIPEHLLESELFGHVKGAFTGATSNKIGKFEYADNGTIFLDEIGDMNPTLQAKLLRFLQEKTIEPIGSNKTKTIDVRIVCATHKNINELQKKGVFRSDLFYRLAGYILEIPPLRARGDDIVDIANFVLSQIKKENPDGFNHIRGFSQSALVAMKNYTWHGNIRELQNKVMTATILCETPLINANDLRLDNVSTNEDNIDIVTLDEFRREKEKPYIENLLTLHNNNISKVAGVLSVSRKTLYALLERYKITIINGN